METVYAEKLYKLEGGNEMKIKFFRQISEFVNKLFENKNGALFSDGTFVKNEEMYRVSMLNG
jgi:hypothetical protein